MSDEQLPDDDDGERTEVAESIATRKARLFLAVNLSVEVTRQVAAATEELRRRAGSAGMRVGWVPPANLHVTVKYLGWQHLAILDTVRDEMREVAAMRGPFDLVARGAGAFPSEDHARVLWVGLDDATGGLTAVAQDLEARMTRIGVAPEGRTYHPHLTLGRVRDGSGAVGDVLAPIRDTVFGTSRIEELVLYESTVGSRGSEYTALTRVSLDLNR